MTIKTTYVPVLIVGGGLAGLSAALFLARHNIPYLLVERHKNTSIHPRARGLNFRTMELYRDIGLDEEIRNVGAQLSKSAGWFTANTLREAELNQSKGDISSQSSRSVKSHFDTYKALSPVTGTRGTQDLIEPILLETACERGGDLRFYTELTAFEQRDHHVRATIFNRSNGMEETVVANYMIAADGAKSPVREMLNIRTIKEKSHGHIMNIYFEADLGGFVEGKEFSALNITHPEAAGLLLAINNKNRWCFHVAYDPNAGESPADFSEERCRKMIQKAIDLPLLQVDILSILPWEAAEKVASCFQHESIFLIGDAAHVMPPTGGYGANTGVQDAHNLAWKLAAVLNKVADPSLLATYDAERRPVAEMTVSQAGRMADTGAFSPMNNVEEDVVLIDSRIVMAGYAYNTEAIVNYDTHHPPTDSFELKGFPGTRAPHIWGEFHGEKMSTLDMPGTGFALFTGEKVEGWKEVSTHITKRFGVEINVYKVGPEGDFITDEHDWKNAFQGTSRSVVLIRPDGFVCWRSDDRIDQPFAALEKVFAQILEK